MHIGFENIILRNKRTAGDLDCEFTLGGFQQREIGMTVQEKHYGVQIVTLPDSNT